MFKILRIISCAISALLVAGCAFVFIYLGNLWGIISLLAAVGFFGLTLLFKTLQERQENKLNPPPPQGDFITGPVSKNNDASDKQN